MTSMLKAGLAAVVVIAGVQASPDVAHARKNKEDKVAARFAGTTDIRDCAKLAVTKRDQCISRSRPVSGASLYKRSLKERAAASIAKVGAATAAVVASAKLALAKDGTTDIRSCAKVDVTKRDQCISRSRPVKGATLMAAAQPAAKVAEAAKAVQAAQPVQAAKVAAGKAVEAAKTTTAATVKTLKGIVAKDGTTDIKDCAKVDLTLRDRCISASRPIKGAGLLSGITKASANDDGLEAAAKAAAVKAVNAIRNVFAKDGTTDIRDCGKVEAGIRDRCISASRPVAGAQLLQRS